MRRCTHVCNFSSISQGQRASLVLPDCDLLSTTTCPPVMPSVGRSPSRPLQFESARQGMGTDEPASPHSSSPQFGSPTFASQPSPTTSSNRHSEWPDAERPLITMSNTYFVAGPQKGVNTNNASPSSRFSYIGIFVTYCCTHVWLHCKASATL